MIFGMHPGMLFGVAIVLFLALHVAMKWSLPLSFIIVAIVIGVLGDFGLPFRHLMEGGFGFINLILALFAGAFFGHMMRQSGAAEAAAAGFVQAVHGNVFLVLTLIGIPIFVVGMFVGLSGVAVLSAGVFAVPAMRRIGFDDATTASFIAVIATAGMIAPPMNVPAMLLADGVNMPWTNVTGALLSLALPMAIAGLAWFTWYYGPSHAPQTNNEKVDWSKAIGGLMPFLLMVAIWLSVRLFPTVVADPASPLILVIGGLVAMPFVSRAKFREAVVASFTGTPLILAAALVAIGIFVQIMTLTGVRGWLVISTMSLGVPWIYPGLVFGMPIIGGPLTSMVVADVMGVPAAFSFIGQDMIINVAALSGIAALAEFVPPTSIAAALSCYVVGGGSIGQVFKRAWGPLLVLVIVALLMLIFASKLTGIIT